MWSTGRNADLIDVDDIPLRHSLLVFLRDWSNEVTIHTDHLERHSAMDLPRMRAAMPRRPLDASSMRAIRDELRPSDTLLFPDIYGPTDDGWIARSHASWFMCLMRPPLRSKPARNLDLKEFPADEFLRSWSNISDVGPMVDPLVLDLVSSKNVTQHLVVASTNDVVLGTVRLTVEDGLGGMSMLAVDRGSRREGLARGLVEHATMLAAQDGCERTYFQVDGHNERAQRLYRSMGAATVSGYRYLSPASMGDTITGHR